MERRACTTALLLVAAGARADDRFEPARCLDDLAVERIEKSERYVGEGDGPVGHEGETFAQVKRIVAGGKAALPALLRLAASPSSVARIAALEAFVLLPLPEGREVFARLRGDRQVVAAFLPGNRALHSAEEISVGEVARRWYPRYLAAAAKPLPPSPPPPRRASVPRDEIICGMRAIAPSLTACRRQFGDDALWMIRLTIEPTGRVSYVASGRAEAEAECIRRAVGEAVFSPFVGPPMEITYPVTASATHRG